MRELSGRVVCRCKLLCHNIKQNHELGYIMRYSIETLHLTLFANLNVRDEDGGKARIRLRRIWSIAIHVPVPCFLTRSLALHCRFV